MFTKIFSKNLLVLILLSAVYLLLRLYHLEESVNFSDEQGKFLLSVLDIWQNKHLTLIGPPTSFNFQGRYFFQGPLIYYLLLPFLLIGKWNALFGSYCLIILNLPAVWLIFYSVKKLMSFWPAVLAASLFVVFPETVYYTKFIWNPNFLPVIAAVLLGLMAGVIKINYRLRVFLIGLFLGLGLQFHYQMLILIILTSGYLILKEKIKVVNGLILSLGFLIGYFPIVLFELKHNFYNTQTIFLLLRNGAFFDSSSTHSYYFLSLFPLMSVLLVFLLLKLWRLNRVLSAVLISVVLVVCLNKDFSDIQSNRGMPVSWTYPDAKTAANIIASQKPSDFNVANLLSGDTRAYVQRYLLATKNITPLAVEDYPDAKQLFVISNSSAEETSSRNVWEISSFNGRVVKTWTINQNNKTYLYEFQKD